MLALLRSLWALGFVGGSFGLGKGLISRMPLGTSRFKVDSRSAWATAKPAEHLA